MTRHAAAAVALAVAAALVFAACGSSEEAAGTRAAQTLPAKTETEPSPPTAKPELEDGRHFGYIESVDLRSNTLVFDLAYLLTGDEANREAAERGYPTPVDNDYFIVDDNPKLRTLALSEDIDLELLDWAHCCDTFFAGDLDRFAASFERKKYVAGKYRGTFSAYEVTVDRGLVVRIDEHYFP